MVSSPLCCGVSWCAVVPGTGHPCGGSLSIRSTLQPQWRGDACAFLSTARCGFRLTPHCLRWPGPGCVSFAEVRVWALCATVTGSGTGGSPRQGRVLIPGEGQMDTGQAVESMRGRVETQVCLPGASIRLPKPLILLWVLGRSGDVEARDLVSLDLERLLERWQFHLILFCQRAGTSPRSLGCQSLGLLLWTRRGGASTRRCSPIVDKPHSTQRCNDFLSERGGLS